MVISFRQLGVQDMTDIYVSSKDLADILIPQVWCLSLLANVHVGIRSETRNVPLKRFIYFEIRVSGGI